MVKPPREADRYDITHYPPRLESVPLSRLRVARLVTEWGHPSLVDDAALLTSELTTNALLHGCLRDRLFRVELLLTGSVLRIVVTDPKGERRPAPRTPAGDDQFGRGLLLVRALAADWGVQELTVGKAVWAELGACPDQERRLDQNPGPPGL
ncbi:ATP-binding protein [Streptomyces sp. A3M-1-3]|uniref:ATP-binding protein n=1 Tax=Streptomyces sp. A3M-1-3 TaxID=2962044 RepID=UPI0020B8F027|nr:ATP-binding protein [Streptomyces sp. A3M-1-3]MCP3822598.1 ATP-binding protein [Streptomyces sp. A3M-1-3]